MTLNKEYIKTLASKGARIDGRKPEDFREITLEKGIIENAEGSALVKFGETEVLVGVKLGIGVPYPDSRDKGILMVGAEFTPLASPSFEKGPPREEAIELARVIDRGIRESKAIDMEKLCIKKNEKVWMVFIDIHILNHAGNLLDAAGLGAISALLSAKMPEYNEKEDQINYDKRVKALPTNAVLVPVTAVKIGETLMLDPNLEEEGAMEARFTMGTRENGNVCSLQKGGAGAFSQEEIFRIFELASKKAGELRKLLK